MNLIRHPVQNFQAPYDATLSSITIWVQSATQYTKRNIDIEMFLHDVTKNTNAEAIVNWDQTPGPVTFTFTDFQIEAGGSMKVFDCLNLKTI